MESENILYTDLDLPPEYCRYQDDGCELTGSCLNCPFPICIYDEPRGKQRRLKGNRDREIVRFFTEEGSGIKELAARFDISQRTVQRALKNYRSTTKEEPQLMELERAKNER